MSETSTLQAELTEARRLMDLRDYNQAVALYEAALRTQRSAVLSGLRSVGDLSMHKQFLLCSLVLQMMAQKNLENGFYVNLGNYCFFDTPSPDVFVSSKAVHAIEVYKGTCTGINALKKDGIFERITDHPQATTLVYYAHSVAADIVDLSMVNRGYPMGRVADFGAGAGLQAVTLALLNRNITSLNLFEIQEFMKESIVDVFKANGVDYFHLNRPIDHPVDCFYSFRACSYLFSVDTYYAEIQKNRSARACAVFDIGNMLGPNYERARFKTLFNAETPVYSFGRPPHHYDRMLFDEPIF